MNIRINTSDRGFTLIELVIVVLIIGIIAAIVVPSYQQYIETTRRTTAQGDLLELAQFMERRYTNGYDFRDAGGNAPALPFTTQPRQGAPVFYNYAFQGNVTRTTFVLQASPANAQTNDPCGWLRIDQAGARTSQSGAADCWQ